MLKAVGFDFDGILARKIDADARERAVNFVLSEIAKLGEYKKDLTFSDKKKGERYEDFFLRLFDGDKKLAIKAINLSDNYYVTQGLDKIKQPILETLSIMKLLAKNNIPFFIATNNSGNYLYFDAFFKNEFPNVPLIPASHFGGLKAKPDPDIILEGFKRLGIEQSVENSIYIGDKISKDLLASVRANTLPVIMFDKAYKFNNKMHEINGCVFKSAVEDINKEQLVEFIFADSKKEFLALNDFNLLYQYIEKRI